MGLDGPCPCHSCMKLSVWGRRIVQLGRRAVDLDGHTFAVVWMKLMEQVKLYDSGEKG